ncbi:hypothetical protein ACIQOV_01050 [Kitasatospora sp. NPDC091257]|uniref:hypothetical protein n=1 Tax=unclassified Kitasatospora TaxID=2633591 RepID=UPI002F90E97D
MTGSDSSSFLGNGDLGDWRLKDSIRVEVALSILDELERLTEGDLDTAQRGADPDGQVSERLNQFRNTLQAERRALRADSDEQAAVEAERVITQYKPVLRAREVAR